jgi:hypothetical protein
MINCRILSILVLMSISQMPAIAAENPGFQIYQSDDDFVDVRENLIDAIINRGYVIDYNGTPGDMLKRTRKDVGGKALYVDAQYLIFCSAVLSRATMEANIHNIGYCPYTLFVYEAVANPGTVYVSYRKPTMIQSSAELDAVEALLDGIAREAVE